MKHYTIKVMCHSQFMKRYTIKVICHSLISYLDIHIRFEYTLNAYQYLYLVCQCFVDGPYGTPTRQIFASEHAVLIGAGIGITPFASILQSIMYQ